MCHIRVLKICLVIMILIDAAVFGMPNQNKDDETESKNINKDNNNEGGVDDIKRYKSADAAGDGFFYNNSVIVVADESGEENTWSPESILKGLKFPSSKNPNNKFQGSSILDTLSSFLGGGSKAKPSDLYQAALHPFMATKGQNNKRQPLPAQSKAPAKEAESTVNLKNPFMPSFEPFQLDPFSLNQVGPNNDGKDNDVKNNQQNSVEEQNQQSTEYYYYYDDDSYGYAEFMNQPQYQNEKPSPQEYQYNEMQSSRPPFQFIEPQPQANAQVQKQQEDKMNMASVDEQVIKDKTPQETQTEFVIPDIKFEIVSQTIKPAIEPQTEKAPVAEVVENDKENELSDLTDFTDASQNWINNRIGGANKESFSNTMTGMMDALMEVQKRGDSMMAGIQKQKRILSALELQVKAEEKKLNDTMKMRQTEEQILNKIKQERNALKAETRQSNDMMKRIADEVKEAEQRKNAMFQDARIIEENLIKLQEEKARSVAEVERLQKELEPLVNQFSTKRVEIDAMTRELEEGRSELQRFAKEIEVSTKSLNDLRTSVTKEQQNLNKINKGTIASSLPEIPFILPIFAMSILGNLFAVGNVAMDMVAIAKRRSDNKPIQFSPPPLPAQGSEYGSEHGTYSPVMGPDHPYAPANNQEEYSQYAPYEVTGPEAYSAHTAPSSRYAPTGTGAAAQHLNQDSMYGEQYGTDASNQVYAPSPSSASYSNPSQTYPSPAQNMMYDEEYDRESGYHLENLLTAPSPEYTENQDFQTGFDAEGYYTLPRHF